MRWEHELEPNERICWEGRPAPRCYVFRNWRHSIFGILLILIAIWWQAVGIQMAAAYNLNFLAWIPMPFVLIGFYLSMGHLIWARFEWGKVCYVITDRRIMVRRGLLRMQTEFMSLDAVTYFYLRSHGSNLGSLRIHGNTENDILRLKCVEYPRKVTVLLEQAMGEKACPVPDGSTE